MASKKTIKRIRDEVEADRGRYDEVTRRLQERIERGLERERQRPVESRKSS